MAVPRNRHSNSRKNNKLSHMGREPKSITVCLNCRNPVLPHYMCPSCGHYKGRSYKAEKEA